MKNHRSAKMMTGNRSATGKAPARLRIGAVAVLCVLATGITACEKRIHTRGNLPNARQLSEIVPGRHSRTDIEELLGTPSTRATFDKETWYYIGYRVQETVFYDPKLLERKVLAVRFRKDGVVDKVQVFNAANGRDIKPVDRQTPTRGKELTFLQQLIGNIGRFGNPRKDRDAPF